MFEFAEKEPRLTRYPHSTFPCIHSSNPFLSQVIASRKFWIGVQW